MAGLPTTASFGSSFNQAVAGTVWLVPLKKMSFGGSFDQPIAEFAWPACRQQLSFEKCYNLAQIAALASREQLSLNNNLD